MSIKHLYEDERPALLLDFANSKTLDPRITFTRNSTATYVDELGVIKTAATGEARIDHDLATGECLGLLLEEERTNEIQDSADFTTANWFIGSNTTRTANQGTAPDGTTTADRIQLSATSSSYIYYQFAVTSGVTYTFSIYIKNYNNTASSFDLYYNPGTPTQLGKTDATNDWVRYTLTVTPSSSGTHQFGINNPPDDYAVDILAWGAQLEEGSFATSFIPTSGSTVTRVKDVAKIPAADLDFYNEPEGTMISKVSYVGKKPGGALQAQWSFGGCSGNSQYGLKLVQYGFNQQLRTGGATAHHINPSVYAGTTTMTDLNNIGVAYALNDLQLTVNGSSAGALTSGFSGPVGATQLDIGNYGDIVGNLHIHSLAYYNTRLSNTALEALTT